MSLIAAGLRGGRGDPGPPFRVDAQGTLADRAAYNNELANFTFLATDNGYLYFKGSLPGQWSEGMLFRGPKGEQGAGFVLRGSVASPAELPLLGALGDAWLITGHAWTWNGTGWHDAGQIQGEKGEDGHDGADGRGVASLAIDGQGQLIVTFTDGSTGNAGVARGADGVGVTSVALSEAGHLLVTLTNGAQVDAGPVPVRHGVDGSNGVGISGVALDGAGRLQVTLTSGATLDAGPVPVRNGVDGQDGTNGTNGVGVTGVAVNEAGNLLVTLTTGSVIDAGHIPVRDGIDGANGLGVSSVAISVTGHLLVTLSNGAVLDAGEVPVVHGTDGKDGTNGTNGTNGIDGTNGADGQDGRGIVSVAINEAKHLIVTFTDNTTADAGPVPSSDEVAALQQTVNELVARIEALESGGPSTPSNALADALGNLLTDGSGTILITGAAA